jgi:hypothetical protein
MLICLLVAAILEKFGIPGAEYVSVGAVAGLLLALIGRVLRKGKSSGATVVDVDVIITSEKIRIGDQTFMVAEVEYLDFLVNSYDGMEGPYIRRGFWVRRMVLRGGDNKIYFTADGKKHSYGFYLEDRMAMQRLGFLFRELYAKRVRFRERNRGGRTFLFERVMNREEFEAAKRSEGYA